MAPFTPEDVDEATSRIERLAAIWRLRLAAAEDHLDERPQHDWTIREIVFHVAESSWYAEAVGDLSKVGAEADRAT